MYLDTTPIAFETAGQRGYDGAGATVTADPAIQGVDMVRWLFGRRRPAPGCRLGTRAAVATAMFAYVIRRTAGSQCQRDRL